MLHRHFMDGNAMFLNQWIELTGIAGNTHDIPVHVQSAVYGTVRDRGINLAGKFVIGAPWNNAPVLEGWVRVHYKYLTEAWSADTFTVFPREGLRSLAEQGGAKIVGCSPSRAVYHFPVSQQLPSAIPSITKIALEDELTWLSIHSPILLLGTSQKGTSPFAFETLQHLVVKEVELSPGCEEGARAREQESTALCLLLADGRFQVLEAEHLELRFDDAGVCSEWATALKDFSCQNVESAHCPGLRSRCCTHAESILRQKGDDPKTDQMTKGADSNLPGWHPKETRPNCQSRADCQNNATPARRPEAVGWAPLV